MKRPSEQPDPLDTAAAAGAVATFAAVPLGEPFADPLDAATAALSELQAAAEGVLFPALVPATADTISLYEFAVELLGRQTFAADLATLHQRALIAAPELGTFLRSGLVIQRVATMAASTAVASAAVGAEAGREAVADYQRSIAAHLIGRPEHEPAASIISVTVPALRARIAACRQRHLEHIAGVLADQQQQTAAAEAALVQHEQAERSELSAFFAARPERRFLLRGGLLSGGALAAAARRAGARDDEGEFVFVGLPDLRALMAHAEAADAVEVKR